LNPQHFLHAKRKLWKKPGTLHECSRAFETCHCRNFAPIGRGAPRHSSSRVLHRRLAGRTLLRREKNFEASGSLPRRAAVISAGRHAPRWRCLCDRQKLSNPTRRDFPRFQASNVHGMGCALHGACSDRVAVSCRRRRAWPKSGLSPSGGSPSRLRATSREQQLNRGDATWSPPRHC
jgi:hypothetical protein